ncbi:MAG TPA: ribosome biogenesis GTPase Der [Myxococcaceae bacterium]|nr:ribosome biogenesis GTPase Der [Myxococcaceae bacterium]
MRPLVAILGRPNVGKSTLFNRIAGRRLALVQDVPGVTRDRHYADAEWQGRELAIVDTGGFVTDEHGGLAAQVRAQAELAAAEADVVLVVVDGRSGPTPADETLARALRRTGKPLILVVNKLDSPAAAETGTGDFYRLGIPDLFPVSAEHALGFDALLDAVVARLPAPGEPVDGAEPEENAPVRLTILGRPNVGKSTLLNALVREERAVANPEPGTTRDPIDTTLVHGGRRFVLTDTAGIRRRKAVGEAVEKLSVLAALRSMERADVAVLVLDGTEPGVDQDARLAGLVAERARALLVVVNKWDLVTKDPRTEKRTREDLKWTLKFVSYAPIVFVSALTGSKVEKVLDLAAGLQDSFRMRIPTPALNKLLGQLVDAHPAPIVDGRPLRLYYIAQVGTAPPAFAVTTNRPEKVPESYKRYLSNQLRETFGLRVPLQLFFREKPGKAKRVARKRPHARR